MSFYVISILNMVLFIEKSTSTSIEIKYYAVLFLSFLPVYTIKISSEILLILLHALGYYIEISYVWH